nr:hypothetical protein BaRGS_019667 [Batillaria attramentaria]
MCMPENLAGSDCTQVKHFSTFFRLSSSSSVRKESDSALSEDGGPTAVATTDWPPESQADPDFLPEEPECVVVLDVVLAVLVREGLCVLFAILGSMVVLDLRRFRASSLSWRYRREVNSACLFTVKLVLLLLLGL